MFRDAFTARVNVSNGCCLPVEIFVRLNMQSSFGLKDFTTTPEGYCSAKDSEPGHPNTQHKPINVWMRRQQSPILQGEALNQGTYGQWRRHAARIGPLLIARKLLQN